MEGASNRQRVPNFNDDSLLEHEQVLRKSDDCIPSELCDLCALCVRPFFGHSVSNQRMFD